MRIAPRMKDLLLVILIISLEMGVVYAAPNLFLQTPSMLCSGVSNDQTGPQPAPQLLQVAYEIEHDPRFLIQTHGACFELRTFYTAINNGPSSIVLVFDHYFGSYLECGRWPARMIWEEIQVTPLFSDNTYTHNFNVVSYRFDPSSLNMNYGCPP
jgi:hypothetical protein